MNDCRVRFGLYCVGRLLGLLVTLILIALFPIPALVVGGLWIVFKLSDAARAERVANFYKLAAMYRDLQAIRARELS